MKRIIIIVGLILLGTQALWATITVDGNAYLENQTNHSGIKVLFERTAPSSLTDSTYTDLIGYYSIDIETGFYDITYSKDGYNSGFLYDQSLFADTTLPDVTLLEHQTLLNVPSDFSTIQSAIDFAWTADTVLVQTGTYYENINYNGKNITVASLFFTTQDTSYISQTIIDGDYDDNVVTFESGEDSTAVLTGFTITNGFAYHSGGIYCNNNSSPSLKNMTITGNFASHNGGGICCYNNSNPILENVAITGNTASADGGGIYCDNYSSPSLINVTITGNTASGNGGGIYCKYYSSPILENITITGNSASGNGGGIYCWNYSSPSLENVTITDNSANCGGGIYCYNYSSPSLVNVTITGNSKSGIYCYNYSSPSLENVTITNNYTTYIGGGIYTYRSNPSLENITITGNSAWQGGGISCSESSPNLVNCIVSENTGDYGIYVYSGSPSITFSDFYNNENGNFYNCGTGVGMNVTTNANGDSCDVYYNIQMNPCFVDTANGDNHLQSISPCIDAGDPNSPKDPDGSIADMGAYPYFQSSIQGTIVLSGGSGDVTQVEIGADGEIVNPNYAGEYIIFIQPGIYDVTASLINYADSTKTNIVVIENQATTNVDFTLYPQVCVNEIIPNEFELIGSYPNPISDRVEISFRIPERSYIEIELYDIRGHFIDVLTNKNMNAGYHETKCDMSTLKNGIYFYKMSVDGVDKEIKKVVLLR